MRRIALRFSALLFFVYVQGMPVHALRVRVSPIGLSAVCDGKTPSPRSTDPVTVSALPKQAIHPVEHLDDKKQPVAAPHPKKNNRLRIPSSATNRQLHHAADRAPGLLFIKPSSSCY